MRKFVSVVAGLAILACAISVLVGAPEGKRLGYQLMTARSTGLSWLVVVVLLAVTGVPLATFVLRDELYQWNRMRMRFERYVRDDRPASWWILVGTYLVLFLVIMGGLFIFSR
ncbi:MAG: hypothetical protein ACT4P9_03880 [Betaproteobacteria bacterium]